MGNVKKYFDSIAENYEKMTSKFFVKYLKEIERKYVLKSLDVRKNEKILDAGCGAGFYSKVINSLGGEVVGIDISPKMIRMTRNNGIKTKVFDLHRLSLNQTFDKILCAGVLEFCKNPKLIIKNLVNHLKSNGILIILFLQITFFGLLYKFYHRFHKIKMKLFTQEEMKRILLSNKLKIIKVDNVNGLSCVIKAKKIS